MRKPEYRFAVALALAGMALVARGQTCERPAGFVDPPRPEIAPLEELISHTEVRYANQSLAANAQAANRPLRIDATKDLPGVTGTARLSNGPYGTVGARRLVCKTDGTTSVEEVLANESGEDFRRFRYVVWNNASPQFRDVAYAVGEFVRTQAAPDKTRIEWTYRFALKSGISAEERARFQKVFVEQQFAEWMRTQMDRKDPAAEAPRSP